MTGCAGAAMRGTDSQTSLTGDRTVNSEAVSEPLTAFANYRKTALGRGVSGCASAHGSSDTPVETTRSVASCRSCHLWGRWARGESPTVSVMIVFCRVPAYYPVRSLASACPKGTCADISSDITSWRKRYIASTITGAN